MNPSTTFSFLVDHQRAAVTGSLLGILLQSAWPLSAATECDGISTPVTLLAGSPAFTESPGATAEFILSLDMPQSRPTQVTFQVSGTALSGSDYQPLPTQVSIPAGHRTAVVTVTALPDAAIEEPESITVTLLSTDQPCVYVGIPSSATVELQDANTFLTAALDDTQLRWITGGSVPWAVITSGAHDGLDAGQSGSPLDGQESWIQMEVTGPGTVGFWWKVSSEPDFDWLRLHVDGRLWQQISGEINWQQRTLQLPSGRHALRWRYVKDGNSFGGQDRAWLDQVSFTPASGEPQIVVPPANRDVWPGAIVELSGVAFGTAPLQYQWYYNGNTAIPGATNVTLRLHPVAAKQAGAYHLEARSGSTATASTPATLTVGPHGPVSQILFFTDSTVPSPFQTALSTLGLAYQSFTDEPSFNAAVGLANRGTTLVVVDAPEFIYGFSSLTAFVGGGGRVVLQAYTLAGNPSLAATLGVAIEKRETTPLPLYNWGGVFLFDGLGSPVSFGEIALLEDVQRLHVLAGGIPVAGFTSARVAGEAAVVVGNDGRTIVNGCYLEGASASVDANRLARNEIAFLAGLGPREPLLSGILRPGSGSPFGFTAVAASDQVVVIDVSSDLRVWRPLLTNSMSAESFPFTDLDPPVLEHRFYRLRSGP